MAFMPKPCHASSHLESYIIYGNALVGGSTSPPNGSKTAPAFGGFDFWAVKVDASGNKLWDQSYGGVNDDYGACIQQTADRGFILAGSSYSAVGGNKTTENFGGTDFWVLKFAPEPPKLHTVPQSAEELRGAGYRLVLAGVPNLTYVTEYSTNLSEWLPIQTNQLQEVEEEIVDLESTNSPTRFYRARVTGLPSR